MAIYISGSLAFDRIMNFAGKFSDSILPDKIHNLNVSFFVENLEEKRGGCAGNIAYSMGLLGKKPIVLSAAGKDFDNYAKVLADLSLPLDGIRIVENKFTASCYINTDQMNNQITAFCASAMLEECDYKFDKLDSKQDLAIVSPGNFDDMRKLSKQYTDAKVRYIYDPGQQIPVIQKDALLEGISGSYIVTSNDYEFEMICKATGKTKAEIFELANCVITTLGEHGSRIQDKDQYKTAVQVKAASVGTVLDPTGAGDAYRSGLLYGLDEGLSLVEAAQIGSTCAAYCIENYGTQEHSFTLAEFWKRHKASFA